MEQKYELAAQCEGEIISHLVFVEPEDRGTGEVSFADPVLATAGSLQDDKCESLDLLVPYQRQGTRQASQWDLGNTECNTVSAYQRPAFSGFRRAGSLKPEARMMLPERC